MFCRHVFGNISGGFRGISRFLGISRDFAEIPEFRGSATTRNIRSPVTGLLIFRGKKSKISRDFQGQIRGKIGRFRGIFAGKKVKIRGKIGRFREIFSGEK